MGGRGRPVDHREAKAERALPAEASAVWPEGTVALGEKRQREERELWLTEQADPPGSH